MNREEFKEEIKKQAKECPFSDDYKRGIIMGGAQALQRAGMIGLLDDLRMALEISTELGLMEV